MLPCFVPITQAAAIPQTGAEALLVPPSWDSSLHVNRHTPSPPSQWRGAEGLLLQLQVRDRPVPLRECCSAQPSRPCVQEGGGVLNRPLTPMQAEGIFLPCSLWRTHGEPGVRRLKQKRESPVPG